MFGHDNQKPFPGQGAQADDSSATDSTTNITAPSLPPVNDTSATTSTPPAPVAAASDLDTDDLLSIKQEALQHLSPLVGHLEQTPEEKFRTTMMMIQAADNQSLIKSAYEAAKEITDEKTRAQALLDIVNEINYFTQHHDGK